MAGHRVAVLVCVVLGFASWVVGLAGISTVTNDAYKNYEGQGVYRWRGEAGNFIDFGQNPVRGLNFQWWGVWFEFIVLCFVAGFAFTNNLASHQGTLTGLLATVTAVNMYNARIFMTIPFYSFTQTNPPNTIQSFIYDSAMYPYGVASRQSGLNTAAAGYVMFCTFNLLLVLLLGSGLVWFNEYDKQPRGASAAVERGPPPTFTPVTFAAPVYSPRTTADVVTR